ncbi:MAG: pyrimidine-nucleoside phosphorylase, partial [Anaerolineae bacterium]
MLALGGKAADKSEALALAMDTLSSGAAWQKFRELVEAQGGDVRAIEEPERLPKAKLIEPVPAPRSGYLAEINAVEVGSAVVELGGGREQKGDPIDHSVGAVVHYKVGDLVQKGTPLFTIHANDEEKLAAACERVLAAHAIGDDPVQRLPIFYKRVAE